MARQRDGEIDVRRNRRSEESTFGGTREKPEPVRRKENTETDPDSIREQSGKTNIVEPAATDDHLIPDDDQMILPSSSGDVGVPFPVGGPVAAVVVRRS